MRETVADSFTEFLYFFFPKVVVRNFLDLFHHQQSKHTFSCPFFLFSTSKLIMTNGIVNGIESQFGGFPSFF